MVFSMMVELAIGCLPSRLTDTTSSAWGTYRVKPKTSYRQAKSTSVMATSAPPRRRKFFFWNTRMVFSRSISAARKPTTEAKRMHTSRVPK